MSSAFGTARSAARSSANARRMAGIGALERAEIARAARTVPARFLKDREPWASS